MLNASLAEAKAVLEDTTLSIDDQSAVDQQAVALQTVLDSLVLIGQDTTSTISTDGSTEEQSGGQNLSESSSEAVTQTGYTTPRTGDNTVAAVGAVLAVAVATAVLAGKRKK